MNLDYNYIVKKYRDGASCKEIADELGTYSKKIERLLKKNGENLRSRSESMKMALDRGRANHPTEGTIRSEEEKIKISEGNAKAWAGISDEERETRVEAAKDRWKKKSPIQKREMQEKAGRALREACVNGSKMEKYLEDQLQKNGHHVVMHKKDLIQGNFEIDLLLPDLNTIIEIDGPTHFLPVFGEERLAETIKLDAIKNGALLAKGYCIIRVKYITRSFSLAKARELSDKVINQVKNIERKFPSKTKRLIELEVT